VPGPSRFCTLCRKQLDERTSKDSDSASATLGYAVNDTTPAADTEVTEDTEGILLAMLGKLYIRYASLSDFEPIGEGGFATVHRAKLKHDNGMMQIVAVKQLRESRLSNSDDLHEFIAVCRPVSFSC
jgi:hypothetical protein